MKKNTAKNTINQAKSRRTPQQLWLRTPTQLKVQYDNRSFSSKLKRAKQRVAGLPFYVSNGKLETVSSHSFLTPRKLSAPTNDLVINNIYINNTPVYARARATGVPERVKIEQKTTKQESLKPKRSMKNVPEEIANWDYSRVVREIDRLFASGYKMKTLRKLRIFGLDALRYAIWAYKNYPQRKARYLPTFDYFFMTAKNFSEDNNIKLKWKEYYC